MECQLLLSLCFFFFLLFFSLPSHGGLLGNLKYHGSVLRLKSQTAPPSVKFDPTRVTQLSWHPRAFIYKGFLTHEECDHLILLAKDELEKSMVADDESGESVDQFWNVPGQGSAGIEERIAVWTFLPPENGEGIQILSYELGQKYEPHLDYFVDKINQRRGGHRIATVLMYLSDVEKGGETVFPTAEEKGQQEKDENWSECAEKGYAVKPNKGDALLFFSLHPDASTDGLSLHGSCPVIEGEKWSATKWIHIRPFDKSEEGEDASFRECKDKNEYCASWALKGECQKNPKYMVGSRKEKGHCRKSCNVC